MSDADDARTWRDESLQFGEYQVAILVDGDSPEFCSPLLCHLLPRYNVGMMVEGGDNDIVARRDILPSEGLCNEVDTLCGTTHEDDILGTGCMDEAGYLLTGSLVGIGSTGSQRMCTAMDVGVIVFVIVTDLVNHLQRLLRGGTVVEPYQIVSIHLLVEHGEVFFDFLAVQRVRLLIVEGTKLFRLWYADAETILGSPLQTSSYRGGF